MRSFPSEPYHTATLSASSRRMRGNRTQVKEEACVQVCLGRTELAGSRRELRLEIHYVCLYVACELILTR